MILVLITEQLCAFGRVSTCAQKGPRSVITDRLQISVEIYWHHYMGKPAKSWCVFYYCFRRNITKNSEKTWHLQCWKGGSVSSCQRLIVGQDKAIESRLNFLHPVPFFFVCLTFFSPLNSQNYLIMTSCESVLYFWYSHFWGGSFVVTINPSTFTSRIQKTPLERVLLTQRTWSNGTLTKPEVSEHVSQSYRQQLHQSHEMQVIFDI